MGHPWIKHCVEFCFMCCKMNVELRDVSLFGLERFGVLVLCSIKADLLQPGVLKGLFDGTHLMRLLNVYSPFLSLLVHLEWLITPSSLCDFSSHSGEKNRLSMLLPLVSFYHSLPQSSPFKSNSIQRALHLPSWPLYNNNYSNGKRDNK